MKFIKNLALSLISLLLFTALSIFGLVFMFDKTLLNPDFLATELSRIDISEAFAKLYPIQSPPEAPYLNKVINKTVTELEPWLKEEINTVIYSSYDYLLGKTPNLRLTIPTDPVKNKLKENLRTAFLDSPPPDSEA